VNVNAVMSLWVLKRAGNFLTCRRPVSFSGRAVLLVCGYLTDERFEPSTWDFVWRWLIEAYGARL
jgi:hypothetical protein